VNIKWISNIQSPQELRRKVRV